MGYADERPWKSALPALVRALQESGIKNPRVLRASNRHLMLSAEQDMDLLMGSESGRDGRVTSWAVDLLGAKSGKRGYVIPLVVKASFTEEDRALAINEMMMTTALQPQAAWAGLVLLARFGLLKGPGLFATLWQRVQGETLASSIQTTAAEDRMRRDDWARLASFVCAGDEMSEIGERLYSSVSAVNLWPDAWLLDRLHSNLRQAVERGLLTQEQSQELSALHGRSPERRLQHHDLGPWNLLRQEKTGQLVLIDAEFGGWRHRLYDAVYLLLQWTLNKPYPAGARAWWAALAAEFGEDRLSWMMTKEARPAVIYRLAATMKELDDSPEAQTRLRTLVHAMLAPHPDQYLDFLSGAEPDEVYGL